jgi:hypothetical protein
MRKSFSLLILILAVALVAAIGGLFLFKAAPSSHPPATEAQEPLIVVSSSTPSCGGVTVLSISNSFDVATDEGFSDDPSPTLTIMPGQSSTIIYADGPLLGSMDSNAVPVELTCTTIGVGLTATITRSANYDGAVLQNIQWRPIVEIKVVLHQPEATFDSTWAMRLSNGVVVDHSHPWPYSGQPYPITVTKTLQASAL